MSLFICSQDVLGGMWTTAVEVGSTPRCFHLDITRTDKTQKLLKHSMFTNIRKLTS